MIFYLYKILIQLFTPFTLLIFIIFYLSFKLKNYKLNISLKIFIFIIYVLSIYPFSNFILLSLEKTYQYYKLQNVPKSDAIVVLAGMIFTPKIKIDEPEFNTHLDRILKAESLIKAKKAPLLFISGTTGKIFTEEIPESLQLKNWLVKRNFNEIFFNEKKIIIDIKSRTTYENILELKNFVQENKIKKILLVTSAFHLPRAMLLINKIINKTNINLIVTPIPCDYQAREIFNNYLDYIIPNISAFQNSTLALKEYLGILYYNKL